MKSLAICLLLAAILAPALSTLQVYMPACATNQMPGTINYTLANFGHIPYGKPVIGEIIVPQESELCNSDNNETFNASSGEGVTRFFLLKRGTCKFTKKILNAQKKGADLVIIYDNERTTVPNIIMSNDGHGHLINIPSIFVANSDGEKLIKTNQGCGNNTILKIYFDVFTSKVASVVFWLDINNRESFITLRDFYRDYYKAVAKHLDMDIKFKINQNCGKQLCEPDDCIKDQKQYCLPVGKIIKGVPLQGKEIIYEQLRSYYLFHSMKQKQTIEDWFEYMIKFDHDLCMEKLDLKECSNAISSKYEKPEVIEAKVVEAVSNVKSGRESPISQFVDDAQRSDILFYPEVSINNRNFYGLFRAPDIFQMICSSLQSPPKECHSFLTSDKSETYGEDHSTGIWKTVFLIICAMLVVFFVALFIYNRLIRSEMNPQLSMEVNKMVEHYVAMTQQKSRSNANMG